MAFDLDEIIQRLNPNVPAGASESAMPRTPRDSNALRQIRTHVSADKHAKVLLTGHIGVGKSTELLQLGKDMSSSRHLIQCSIAQKLGAQNVETFSLLLIVLEASIRSWITSFGNLPIGLIEELVGHVRMLIPESKRPPKKPPSDPPLKVLGRLEYEVLSKLLAGHDPRELSTGKQLADLYAEILQRLALRYLQPEQVSGIDPSAIALSCELLLKELANKADKPVLVLIDDLDKIRSPHAQLEVFVERAMAWIRLPCAVVATLPLDVYFSELGRELDQTWGDVHVLEPLPVPPIDGESTNDPSLQFFLAMLRSVHAQKVISALQCRKLAHAASGIPRLFVQLCVAATRYALDAKEKHVRDYHIDLVLTDQTNKWRSRLNDSDYEALVNVLDSGGSNVPQALPLLRDGLLIRDGSAPDSDQVRLVSWAVPLVGAYRARKAKK